MPEEQSQFGPPSLAPIPPEVQAERDRVRSGILQDELRANPGDAALRQEIAFDQQRQRPLPPSDAAPQLRQNPERVAIDSMVAQAEQDADLILPEITVTADPLPLLPGEKRIDAPPKGIMPPGYSLRRPTQASIATPSSPALSPIENRGAPVSDEAFGAIKQVYEDATPEIRQRMIAGDSVVSRVARKIHESYGRTTEQIAAAPDALGRFDERLEAREARAVPDRIGPSDFDWETYAGLRPDGSMSRSVKRGGYLGAKQLKQQTLGLHRAIGDLIGAEGYTEAMTAAGKKTRAEIDIAGDGGTAFQKNFEGAIASTISQAPGLAVAIGTGGQTIPLTMMGAQVFGQEYAEGRDAGLDKDKALVRGAIIGAAEILGEKVSLGATTKALREGMRRSVDAIRQAPKDASREALTDLFMKSLAKENIGEQVTTAMQFGTDVAPVIGLTPDATMGDYLSAVADTLVQTTIQSGIMMGTATGPGAVTSHLRSDGNTEALAEAPAQDAKVKALAAWQQAFRGTKAKEAPSSAPRVEPEIKTAPEVASGPAEPAIDVPPGVVAPAPAPEREEQRAAARTEPVAADTEPVPQEPRQESRKPLVTDIDSGREEPALGPQPETAEAAGARIEPTILVSPETADREAPPIVKPYTEKEAALKAGMLTKAGTPSRAAPHPTVPGKFAVVPAAEPALESATPAPTVEDIHALADSKAIPWDSDPAFMALTEEVTGKKHLDDLTADDRKALVDRLNAEVAPPQAEESPATASATALRKPEQFGEAIDIAANEAATSPANALPEPTEAQKEKGNYRKGHFRISGLDVSIENPAGSERSGTDASGKPWTVQMGSHYGYIAGVPARAPDKEHVDVYVKPGSAPDFEGDVFVVNQVKPETGRYDEPKIMIAYETEAEARRAYSENYTKDWKGLGSIVRVPMERFRSMLQDPEVFKRPIQPGETRAELAAVGADDGARVRVVEGPARMQGKVGILLSRGRIQLKDGMIHPLGNSARLELMNNDEDATAGRRENLRKPEESDIGEMLTKVDISGANENLIKPKVPAVRPLRAYPSEKSAAVKAKSLSWNGVAHVVIPHPADRSRFAVVPQDDPRAVGDGEDRDVLGMPASIASVLGDHDVSGESETEPDRAGKTVAMMPGAQHTGFIDDSKQATSTVRSGEPIRREDVLARFLTALDAPIYEGRVQGKQRLGYYRPKLETVRIKRASDLETAAHELAHLIDDRVFNGFGAQKSVPKTRPWTTGPKAKVFAGELRGVSYDATKVYEGWAEYVRLWMTQPEKAAAAAPEFTKWFETFVQQHPYGPAMRQAQQDMLEWFGQDALARARSKIGETEGINRHLNGFWDRFRQSTADDLHGVYRMERDLSGEITPRGAYETARLTRGAHAIMDGVIRYGHLVKKPDGSFGFEGKGLEAILKPVANRLEDFLLYAVGRSARELQAQGREHLFTPGEIKAMVAQETPEFRKAFAEYQAWNQGILDFAEAHGIINSHARSQWKRAEYLPFHRVGTGDQKRVGGAEGNWKGIQKLTGGTDNIRDVLGNMIGNAAMLIETALKNDARAQIARLAQTTPRGGRFLEQIPAESRLVKLEKEQVRQKLLEAAGVAGRTDASQAGVLKTIDGLLENAPFLMDFLVKGQTPTGGNIMAVLKDGKPTYYEVIDPILYRAVSALNRPAQDTLRKWLSLPKRIGQASITLTPDFAVANIARDTLMGAVMSRAGFVPIIDSLKGLTSRLRGDPAYLEYIANGGGYASYFVDESAFRAHLQRFYARRGINPRTVIDGPRNLLYFMETVFDAFELSTRLGEYKQARRRGIHPRAAAYMGREVSTDFGMRGDSKTLGFFYDTVMFLRPAVVSMDRLFRGVTNDPNRGAIAAKTAAIALASAVLFLMNRDHEEYKDLEDWDRDNYWHFFIPGPDGKDLHFRYPKIWEIGAIATLAERSVERFLDKEPKKYAADFTRVLGQAFHLNLMPQVLAPLQEQLTNRDSFTGHPIEPRGLEALQPFLRAKPYTSETLRQLGLATKDLPEALQVNPVRTEALLTGYLNTWAMYGLMAADSAFFSDQIPERRFDQYPVIRRFFRQDPPIHTKHEQRFYELLDETRRLRNTMRELDRSGEELDLSEDDEAGQDVVRELEKVQRDIVRMRREADEIRRSDLSPADKRKELDAITAERNAIFKEAVKEIQQ